MARSTRRWLLQQRGPTVEQPGTWGVWGGAIDDGEEALPAFTRELREESGFTGRVISVPALLFKKGSFSYQNFLGVVEEEFKPVLSWETKAFGWFPYGEWPEPLHFGLKALLDDKASATKMRALSYPGMFRVLAGLQRCLRL